MFRKTKYAFDGLVNRLSTVAPVLVRPFSHAYATEKEEECDSLKGVRIGVACGTTIGISISTVLPYIVSLSSSDSGFEGLFDPRNLLIVPAAVWAADGLCALNKYWDDWFTTKDERIIESARKISGYDDSEKEFLRASGHAESDISDLLLNRSEEYEGYVGDPDDDKYRMTE